MDYVEWLGKFTKNPPKCCWIAVSLWYNVLPWCTVPYEMPNLSIKWRLGSVKYRIPCNVELEQNSFTAPYGKSDSNKFRIFSMVSVIFEELTLHVIFFHGAWILPMLEIWFTSSEIAWAIYKSSARDLEKNI